MERLFSRRDFCMTAVVLGATVALTGCSSQQKPTSSDSPSTALDADVVIIGSGLAGSACARSAAEHGASVILVDKAATLGSTFLTSGGNVSICQIEDNKEFWQFEDGEEDTIDSAIARYTKATETGKIQAKYPDYDRVRTMMKESCETVSWAEGIGLDFVKSFTKDMVGTDTVKPDVSAEPEGTVAGTAYMKKMEDKLKELGVTIMYNTEATKLIEENGAVCGITVSRQGKDIDIKAGAVVLATGGFGASEDYCDKLVPAINEIGFVYKGNSFNTGDGMTLAQAVGGAIYEDCWVIPNVIVPCRELVEADPTFLKLCDQSMFGSFIDGAQPSSKLLVDKAGERFISEASAPIALAAAFADRNAVPYYVLFDSTNQDVATLLDSHVDNKNVFKASSIDELAAAAGISKLPDSLSAYQDACAKGEDAAFNKNAEKLVPYSDGNLYLVKYVPSYVATMGGVKTDADCCVINDGGAAIPGLYAIGEATHRFMYNRSFVRHYSNSSAITMGRLTGASIAQA